MARIKQGFLGNASGKLGNVVFAKWRDINTARQYQPDVHDANTAAQKKQRSRMVGLLQFLKPLNKNFIKMFNTSLAKGSTPWAVAIKENMQGVSPEGCFPLQNLRLGNPTIPPMDLENVVYNPFIDCLSFKYGPFPHPTPQNPFPLTAVSVLGKYASDNDMHEFDIRHPMCMLPPGHFFCSYYDENYEHVFDNWFSGGMFWFMYFDTYDIESIYNPNNGLSEPTYFEPVSKVEGFNTKIKENPVPREAITWEYVIREGKTSLVFSVDYKKTTLKNPKEYTAILWGVALHDGKHEQSDPIEWDLSNKSHSIEISDSIAKGSFIILYSVLHKTGEQVGRFNKFYINKNSEGKEIPYFNQLFDTGYGYPASFVLSGNQCGFCGNIDELFSDFIELWEQGIIHSDDDPAPTKEVMLNRTVGPNGVVAVSDFIREDGDNFYFNENAKATFVTNADAGYEFSKWSGADAAEVVKKADNSYELLMSKDRSIAAEFKQIV
jgi:hypothetical protein